MEQFFTYTFHIPGTLVTDIHIAFAVPCNCQLVHVSAAGTNQHDARLQIGTPQTDSAFLPHKAVGCLGEAAILKREDFYGGQYPHLTKDEAVQVRVDYDGEDGTAVQNLTLALTFACG